MSYILAFNRIDKEGIVFRSYRTIFFLFILLLASPLHAAGKWSGNVALEYRHFTESALDNRQHGDNASFSAQPEYFRRWDGERQSFTFVPFLRIDENDPERSHFDIRELTWVKVNKNGASEFARCIGA